LASISAGCPTLASSIAVAEVIEVAAGVKWGFMAAVTSFAFRNMVQRPSTLSTMTLVRDECHSSSLAGGVELGKVRRKKLVN
jgi:hypothetical protein